MGENGSFFGIEDARIQSSDSVVMLAYFCGSRKMDATNRYVVFPGQSNPRLSDV